MNVIEDPVDAADVAGGDIPPLRWDGAPIDCSTCEYQHLLAAQRCQPGRTCMQDRYARRIDRFFRRNPEFGTEQLGHAYFEVRAIAVRHADIFHVAALMTDADETVRHSVAMRLPQRQLLRMADDPHREVRIRVAYRLDTGSVAIMRNDPDYHVRTVVARRMPKALLGLMTSDADEAVRREVAQRIEMPALLKLTDDSSTAVRCVVASRVPTGLLARFVHDPEWRVRWEVVQRADAEVLRSMLGDADSELRRVAAERLSALNAM